MPSLINKTLNSPFNGFNSMAGQYLHEVLAYDVRVADAVILWNPAQKRD